ncbi:MAG: efflux RND transporter permease subunit [Candidatus Saganbacteria bacterium]|nr:efflux RND transporter permease subunit [Candidatus Saganbacteria bacterium]
MIRNFVTKPLFTLSIFIVLVIVGVFSYSRLSLDFLPNISIPTLTIITTYPGASAEDIETTVSKVIEDAVATVPNVDKIQSNSTENLSTVTLNFKWGTNLDPASADVRDKMDLIRAKLPKDVDSPAIFKFDLSQIPVLVLGISADDSYSGLYDLVDKKITNSLKRVSGVGTVNISGGLKRQINVDIDRSRLEAYHLSVAQINQALAAANLSMPAGSFKTKELEYSIRIPGEFTSVDEIKQVIVGSFQGRDIYLFDIAEVSDYFKEPDSITEVDGQSGVMVQIQKQSGANTVQVVAGIRKVLDEIKGELPADVKITYIQDTSEYILRTVNELTHTLYWAFFFVVLTVLFFLRNVRGSFIISLAMPASIIAAFIYMFLSGTSINMLSLASIIISIGVVVDDAIVILENIYRHRELKHEPPKEGSIYGAGEVSGAVIASTTTNLVIFIPLLLVQGFIAIFFREFSLITIVIISMSLVTAMTLTPMLCSTVLDVRKKGENKYPFLEKLYERSEEWFQAVEGAYKKVLAFALNRRRLVVSVCVGFFLVSMFLFMFVGTEFFPDQDSGSITANIALPAGANLNQTTAVMKTLESRIQQSVPELQFVLVTAGNSARTSLSTQTGPNYGKVYLKVVPLDKRKRTLKEIQKQITDVAFSIPGLKSIDFAESGANAITGGGKPITLEIYGMDFGKIDDVAALLKDKIKSVPGIVDPILSREKTNPEYALNIDRAKAADLGLSVSDIAMFTRWYLYGNTATKYRDEGNEYDIFVRLKESNRKNIEDIKNVFITTRTGKNIALSNIAHFELKSAPQTIERKNQQRYMTIQSDTYGRPLGDIIGDIQKIINKTSLPQDITIKMAGSAEQMKESFSSLLMALMLGMALIYLVMVAQFESFLDPFIIMFAIPFALAGVVWSLFLSGTPFGVMSFIGLIMVVGIAVKNSIVLVDFTNILRARGIELKEAILEAGRNRLRPILMTTATASLGLMPILLGRGEGSGFWKGMSVAVLGGLIVSATISLVFVPTLYYIVESKLKNRHAGPSTSGGK